MSPLEPSEESLQPSGAAANTSAAANAPVGDAEPDDCSSQLQLQVTCEDKLSQPPHLECVASQSATVGSLPQQTQASSRSQKLSATPSQPVHVHSGSPVPKPRARTRERTQQHSPEPSRSPGLDTDDDIEEANAPVQQAFAPQLDYVYDHSRDYGHQHTLKPEAQPFVPAYVNEHTPRSGHDDEAAGLEGFDGEVQQPSQIGTHRPNSPQHTMAREALTLEQVIQSAFVNAAHALTQVQPAAATVSTPTAQFKLKPMELPTFDGQVTEWPDFWDMFETAVDSQPLADVVKLTYLKGALTSTAAKSLSGLATTNTNYAVAVRLLKEKYGRTDDIIAALYSKLQRMHTTTSKHSDIRHTVDCLERILRQLSATGVAVDQQPLLVQHILSKFPTEVLTKLEEWRTSMGQQSWTVPTLRSSLQRYAEIHRNVRAGQDSNTGPHHKSQITAPTPRPRHPTVVQGTAQSLVADSARNNPPSLCILCNGAHFNDQCKQFSSTEDRRRRLHELGRCYICLRSGHIAGKCPSSSRQKCYHCQAVGKHNRTICPNRTAKPRVHSRQQKPVNSSLSADANTTTENTTTTSVEQTTVTSTDSHLHNQRILLQTASISLVARDGSPVTARALLDSGSNRTYITNRLQEQLQLAPTTRETITVFTFGTNKPQRISAAVVNVTAVTQNNTPIILEARSIKTITQPIMRHPVPEEDLAYLETLEGSCLADVAPDVAEKTNVDILIGTDCIWDIVTGAPQQLPSGLHRLPTCFGNIVTGKCCMFQEETQACLSITPPRDLEGEVSLLSTASASDQNLTEFWRLDRIGIEDPACQPSDGDIIAEFNDSIHFKDGRYEVKLPWKARADNLPTNRNLAYGRMRSLSHRLAVNPTLLSRYNDVIQQQLSKGIIESATDSSTKEIKQHYLPHHPVLSPGKSTTKVRIVYDASAKTQANAPSLNDCLHQGPVQLPTLCGILLRFRMSPIVMTADVEKAFLQVSISPTDRDVTRFFWYRDPAKPAVLKDNLVEYRFCRLPFGLICSPFLLENTLRFHLASNGTKTADSILENLYVDNVILGCDTVDEAKTLHEETRSIFSRASMNIREWNTNNPAVAADFSPDISATSSQQSVLGLRWDSQRDTLNVPGSNDVTSFSDAITKRSVLQRATKIFDPLGLITPITYHAKLFLQQLWLHQLEWDEPLPVDLQEEWSHIAKTLQSISTLLLPRLINTESTTARLELHVFCDASAKAYATAAYLRPISGKRQPQLAFAKMRLVPSGRRLKRTDKPGIPGFSMPRLELMANVISVRIANFVRADLPSFLSPQCHIWTDSQCILHWLANTKQLKVFVANRVNEIHALENAVFHYVPSAHNPADIATRGSTAEELPGSTWFHGPVWLSGPPSAWPSWQQPDLTPDNIRLVQEESRGPDVLFSTTLSATSQRPSTLLSLANATSSLTRLLKVTVLLIKFLQRRIWNRLPTSRKGEYDTRYPYLAKLLRDLSNNNSASGKDTQMATTLWIRLTQEAHYEEAMASVHSGQPTGIARQLGLHFDSSGVLRCTSRMPYTDNIHGVDPVLLPGKAAFTRLVIEHVHSRLHHAGVSHTLAQTRLSYWVPKGRATTQSIIHKCVTCRKAQGPPYPLPRMAPLPETRTTRSRPFTHIGIDYMGPLHVSNNPAPTDKVWICLMTCFATRAIHLELVTSLSSLEFLQALRRFSARRGPPLSVLVDNGSQFRPVQRAIDQLTEASGEGADSPWRIKWHYTTEYAHWQGGVFERLVGITKQALKKAIGRKRLTFMEMTTLLAETEAIVNTRPLTFV